MATCSIVPPRSPMCWCCDGVEPGDRVAVQVEKTVENFLLYLAVLRAGAVYLPLNTAYTLAELDYFIGDAEPKLVVCDPAKARRAWPRSPGSAVWRRSRRSMPRARHPDRCRRQGAEGISPMCRASDDDLAADPLHVGHDRALQGRDADAPQSVVECARRCVNYWRFTDKDVLLHALPIYHTHGLFVASNTLMLGRRLDDLPAEIRCRRGHAAAAAGAPR